MKSQESLHIIDIHCITQLIGCVKAKDDPHCRKIDSVQFHGDCLDWRRLMGTRKGAEGPGSDQDNAVKRLNKQSKTPPFSGLEGHF